MSPLARNLIRIAALASAAPLLMGVQGMHSNFDSRLLAGHNRERIAMGLAPMEWDDRLARDAQVWADKLASTGQFYHSPNEPGQPLEGENLWAGTRGAYTPEDMVGLWLAEKRYFRPGRFPDNSITGNVMDVAHYTQLIWYDTFRVGCAVASGAKEDVLVCRYSTYGNVIGDNPLLGDQQATRLAAMAATPPVVSASVNIDFNPIPARLDFMTDALRPEAVTIPTFDFGPLGQDPFAMKGPERQRFEAAPIGFGPVSVPTFDPGRVK